MTKVKLSHEHEDKIALYCIKNNVDFHVANAYEITLETFKTDPIKETVKDEKTGQSTEVTVTQSIAREIEYNNNTIERIAEKIDYQRAQLQKLAQDQQIKQAKTLSKPDLSKLVENLYRLNIVDKHSYLALVCFLMQLKYSRDSEIPENDKTCVFFNGVARNGKSATAKAICDVESKYGNIFKAQSGKILSSTHEEQVWKSHLNYFDEVRPIDIERELLLSIVNGGSVELNPKGKKAYNYHVNTNNIFTSNAEISLKQRRVSVIKFGDRLNGRPLGNGTLCNVVTDIMHSLPNFDHYYDLYQIVSTHNENRILAIAIEHIITYLDSKLGFVGHSDENTLKKSVVFAVHDVINCVKNTYNKQALRSEIREAVMSALDFLEENKLITKVEYANCTTRYYKVSGLDYIRIMEHYQKINTCDEQNIKITQEELYECLAPYFVIDPTPSESANAGIKEAEKTEEAEIKEELKELTPEEPAILNTNDLNNTTTSLTKQVDAPTCCVLTDPSPHETLSIADTKAKDIKPEPEEKAPKEQICLENQPQSTD